MSEDLTVTYSGLSADERRVIINDKRAVRLRHGCAITERRALDRTASELQDTCHKQAQRIEVLEQAVAVPLTDEQIARIARSVLETPVADGVAPAWALAVGIARAIEAAHGIKGGQHGAE